MYGCMTIKRKSYQSFILSEIEMVAAHMITEVTWLYLVCFATSLLATSEESQAETLVNIDFLGMGYDAFYGNPLTDVQDPGFRHPVLKLTYNERSLTADGRWLLPDNVQSLPVPSCNFHTQYAEMNGVILYRKLLSTEASIEGDSQWDPSRFSLSDEYAELKEKTEKYRSSYVGTIAKCSQYKALVKNRSKVTVTAEFAKAVLKLPEIPNDHEYFKFISTFGTHYVDSVLMGAKVFVSSRFNQTAWTEFGQLGVDIQTAAEGSFNALVGGKILDEDQKNKFESSRMTYKVAYVGSHPSSDGRWESWKDSVAKSPYPIGLNLRPLSELFTESIIPGATGQSLRAKSKLWNYMYGRYCEEYPDCKAPEWEWNPVKMDRVESTIVMVDYVSCRPGYNLLSCGTENADLENDEEERYRRAYPISSKTCYCYDGHGMKCVAWCSSAVVGFEKVQKVSAGTFTVTCPAGKKVLGCHAEPIFDTHPTDYERWRHYYPNEDGRSCTCFDTFGTACVASCASNIFSHEIIKVYDFGEFSVHCSPGKYVLGCGINPIYIDNDSYDLHRTVHVDTMSSCRCYDPFGANCYAICGMFGS